MRHAFNAAVDESLELSQAVSDQRGAEYADSWALENQATRFLDMTLREIGAGRTTQEEKRLIIVACLCDVKISRTLGGYKEDTLVDLQNYLAALRSWMAAYAAKKERT